MTGFIRWRNFGLCISVPGRFVRRSATQPDCLLSYILEVKLGILDQDILYDVCTSALSAERQSFELGALLVEVESRPSEPHWVCPRPFGLSYAALAELA